MTVLKSEAVASVPAEREFRKTATIRATQWFKMGDHPAVILRSFGPTLAGVPTPWVETLEGGHFVTSGDWIATGIKGEHWPIKPDVFAATYEAVTDDTPTSLPVQEERVREIVTPVLCTGLTTQDYRNAPSGIGPKTGDWEDKPHRLVYDLCREIEQLAFRDKPTEPTRSAECDRYPLDALEALNIMHTAFAGYADTPAKVGAVVIARATLDDRKPTPQDSDKPSGEAMPVREFVSRLSETLLTIYRRNGGIAKLARGTGGAMTIRNIAVNEAAELYKTTIAVRTDAPSISEGGA